MLMLAFQYVTAMLECGEQLRDRGMVDRQLGVVMLQVLLADISDIAVFVVFREQVIKRLLPFRAHRLGNGFPPFLGIREFGIDIENDAPSSEERRVGKE